MSRHAVLLSRAPYCDHPALPVLGGMSLTLARTHEICGPARRTLAAAVAAACQGPVLWIAPGWQTEQLNGEGLTEWIDPGRLLLLRVPRSEDLLWAAEEALRSGAAPLVVVELPAPPGLTPVRRLHLAAEAGATAGPEKPLGLLLTPGDGGAAGVESRWHLAPAHSARRNAWRLERRRARTAPPAHWLLGDHIDNRTGRCALQPQPDPAPTKSQVRVS